jgi:hypothetical protein
MVIKKVFISATGNSGETIEPMKSLVYKLILNTNNILKLYAQGNLGEIDNNI